MRNILFLLTAVIYTSVCVHAQTVLPNVPNKKAVEQIKQNGFYDSLMEAFKEISPEYSQASKDNAGIGDSFVESAKLVANDGASGDVFGLNISVSGDTVIIGAYRDNIGANAQQGSAYVFVRLGTVWTLQQKLIAADGAAEDGFGSSVAISGDTIVVGAPNDDIGGNNNQGSAYIFIRSGLTWTLQQKLTATDGASEDGFGAEVVTDGNIAICSAASDDVISNSNQGSAYVFVKGTVPRGWTQRQKLTALDGAADDYFGRSIAVWGDALVIGAPRDDVGTNLDHGSAYVFIKSSAGHFYQQQKLTFSSTEADDFFGSGVAINGDTIVVGAYNDANGVNEAQGSASVFIRSGSFWSEEQKLIAADGEAGDFFGMNVAILGDTIVVGAYQDKIGSNFVQGSAYVFTRNNSGWILQQKLMAADGSTQDFFGVSTAISGNTIFVGASGDNLARGSVYAFTQSNANWIQ